MAKVLVSDSLSKEGLELLKNSKGIEVEYKPGLNEEDLAKALAGVEGLVIRSGSKVTAKVIEAADKLKVVGRAGIGVDNVDVKAASRRGIIVMNTPTGNAVTTAEHALALLFSVARKVPLASSLMKEGKWEKKALEGRELSGKTLGVIGLGNIGRIVADRARGLRMNVVGYDPFMTAERASELGIELLSLDELFSRSDAITVHTPLTAETKGLVNDTTIAKMKKGVLLVNAARGGIYDEAALVRGLDSGQIGGVGLDVFPEEPPGLTDIVKHPKAVVTPHLGASTEEAQLRVAVEIAQQVVSYLTTGEISNSVNVPSVPREMAPVLGPYLGLARGLGQFLSQVEAVRPKTIEIEFAGEAATLPSASIVNSALAGLLAASFDVPVNTVNAPMVAKDGGIEVREQKTTHKKVEFSTLITLTVVAADGKRASVSGTLASDRTARLVRWNNYEMEAHLDGSVLVVKNQDKPGVIGTIGTILGAAGINVSSMQMGLDKTTKEAAALWALDSALPASVLEQVRGAKDVTRAAVVSIARPE
ncbi:MAG TPA: phosphoglycerate dehydrogenase [Polyangiaceae bacterium]|nr:phosphoglycerate dehydrogenase [Polyangiaceae bacterium]